AIAPEAFGLHRRRIGFEGNLHAWFHPPVRGDRVDDRRNGLRLHQRGCSAAEEDAGDGAWSRAFAHMRYFPRESVGETRLVDRLAAYVAVEVAIGAFGRAKRPMDIDAEARTVVRHFHDSRASANFLKAR